MLGRLEVGGGSLCSACHALREGGVAATLLAQSEVALFALLVARLAGHRPVSQGCSLVPWRRVAPYPLSARQHEATAAVATLLAWAKLQDELLDGARLARWGLAALTGRAGRAAQRLESMGFSVEVLERLAATQAAVEKRSSDLEELEAPTARACGALCGFAADLAERPECRPAMEAAGEYLGRLMYLWDALDDQVSDRRQGRFNALERCEFGRVEARRRLEQHLQGFERELPFVFSAVTEGWRRRWETELGPAPSPRRRLARAGMLLCCGASTAADREALEQSVQAGRENFLQRRKSGTRCPRCHDSMEEIEVGDLTLNSCGSCAGLWFDEHELERLTLLPEVPDGLLDRQEALWKRRAMPPGSRRCPRCREYLKVLEEGTAHIDVCPGCKGTWVDQNEVRRLLRTARPATYTCTYCGCENKERKTCSGCGAPYREAVG